MASDNELLRRYAASRSEEAFGELVRRHLNLVYFTALRRTNSDAHLAEEVAQLVFVTLARQARSLQRHSVLSGWLYVATRHAAAKAMRAEQRRKTREQEAHAMQEISSTPTPGADWNRLRPELDAVLDDLSDRDRNAVLLRFFENRPFAEIGTALRLSEDAARMRADRALDKLRLLLARRGITSTTAALALALEQPAGAAAPTALAATVTGVALAGVSVVGTGSAITGGLLTLMSMTKIKIGIVTAVILAGAIGLEFQYKANARLEGEITGLRRRDLENSRLRADLEKQVQQERARATQLEAALADKNEKNPLLAGNPEPIQERGVTTTPPAGWAKNGSKPTAYIAGQDYTQSFDGLPSAYVKSVEPTVDGFGGVMQMSSASEYLGKRVRFSGWVKTLDVNDGGGHLWFRVDGPPVEGKPAPSSLQFDNMGDRPIKGNTDWQQYSVVLDVPPESTRLAYGFFVAGTGQMWVSGTKIEEVGSEVPSTDMLAKRHLAQ